MNILIDGNDPKYARNIAIAIAEYLKLTLVDYNYREELNTKAGTINGNWLLVGLPKDSVQYRKVSADGYSPDIVFCVDRFATSPKVARIELFYENIIYSFCGDAFWVCTEIIKAVKAETSTL